VFERHRPEWSRTHDGEFVVIQGEKVAGFYADYEAALRAGLKGFGLLTPFLVKQVSRQEPVFVIF